MASEVKVELIHEETIRPSFPTPHHLKTTNLSFFDQINPQTYVPLLLFYPSCNSSSEQVDNVNILKTSLSETLSHFYPFAGHFQWNDSICCDDRGAKFIEARVHYPLSKILEKPDLVMAKKFLPADVTSTQAVTGHLLLVQANLFACGGLVIGVMVVHKVADASTFSTLIKSWAETALSLSTHHQVELSQEFGVAASLFPPLDFLNRPQEVVEFAVENRILTRRFMFDASSIAALKSKAASVTVPNPTRVEVVSALIWKCAMEASRRPGCLRPSVWSNAVNMRKLLGPRVKPLGEKALLGNLAGMLISKTKESEVHDDHDHNVRSLVSKLRKGIEEFKVRYGNGIAWNDVCGMCEEFGSLIKRDDLDNYTCSSWCRFPFYESNFGWGKPSWIAFPSVEFKNIIVLIDARDGEGIEATVSLKEEDMAIFENMEELLAYASLNPSLIS